MIHKLTLTDEQLRLIQTALDLYSRIGIGQFEHILDHPTFISQLYTKCTIKDEQINLVDYTLYHELRDIAKVDLARIRNSLCDLTVGTNGSYGIYSKEVDESCRVAYDLVQAIRHEYWKVNPNKSSVTVDSSVLYSTEGAQNIKVELDV